jgi:putative hydrolase of the HAD superfamily
MDSASSDTGHPTGTARTPPAAPHTTGTGNHRRAAPACHHTGRRNRAAHRPPVDTLICGIDNVLITFDPAVPQHIEATYGLPAGLLLDTLLEWPTAKLASVGAIDYPTWLRYARQALPRRAVDEWLNYHGSINQPVADLLHTAKHAGLRLYLLANGTDRTYHDLAHHQLTDLADRTYISADIGHAKPDPRAYQHVLHHTTANPTHTTYIDHNPTWVHAGQQLRLRGLTYHNPNQLQHALTQAGVIT